MREKFYYNNYKAVENSFNWHNVLGWKQWKTEVGENKARRAGALCVFEKKKQCSENLRNKSKNAAHRHWHRKKKSMSDDYMSQ